MARPAMNDATSSAILIFAIVLLGAFYGGGLLWLFAWGFRLGAQKALDLVQAEVMRLLLDEPEITGRALAARLRKHREDCR